MNISAVDRKTQEQLVALETQLAKATGHDQDLDEAIAETIVPAGHKIVRRKYTSSVDACLCLIGTTLPGWHWHVGHGPTGILPYAALTKSANRDGDVQLRVEATAPTVPLALLRAAVKALIAD